MAVEQCRKCGVWNCAGGDSCKSDLYENGAEDGVKKAIAAVSDNCPECNGDGKIDRGDGYDDDCPHCLVAIKAIYAETGVTR